MTISVMGQFTYFNQLSLEEGLPSGNLETTTNIEVVGDSLILWGGRVVGGMPYLYIDKLDEEAVSHQSIDIDLEGTLVYIGTTSSFLKIPGTTDFLFTHTKVDSVSRGFVMRVNEHLDTLWTRTYDEYFPETSFYTHALSENGFIIAGEHGPVPGERGTFIMEIDTAGHVLWHNEIHAPDEGLFRTYVISQYGDVYIASGVDQAGDNQSYLEILSTSGDLLVSFQDDNPPPLGQGGQMLHLINSENKVIACQAVSYSWLTPQSLAYNAIRVYELDTVAQELVMQEEYFEDEDWLGGHMRKIIEVTDGYVLMGGYRETVAGVNQRKAWIMKVDNNFQQEWYTELSYDDAPGNAHYPYDMEQTSDGGYVVVGAYRNSADFYDRTWLVKVDACGDLQWQGCEPLGIEEKPEALAKSELELFPNPVRDCMQLRAPSVHGQGGDWRSWIIIDHSGKIVGQMNLESFHQAITDLKIPVASLSSGLYTLRLTLEDGTNLSGRFIKE